MKNRALLQNILLNDAGVAALVQAKIAINAVPADTRAPYIAISTQQAHDYGLAGNLLGTTVSASIQCWAITPDVAVQVALAAQRALEAAGLRIDSDADGVDEDAGLHAVILNLDDILSALEAFAQPVTAPSTL